MVELWHIDLIAARDEIVSSQHFNVLLSIELGQVVDYVLTAECLPNREILLHEAAGDLIEDCLGDVEHLLFVNLRLCLIINLFSRLVVVVIRVLVL